MKLLRYSSVIFAGALSFGATAAQAQLAGPPVVIASGLEGPRGLKFGPDGDLYVAEAGLGGTVSTKKICPQVPTPPGPYTGGLTGRISKIDRNNHRTTVASGFPSTISAGGTI